jgi:hypothetical protein
MYDIVIGNNPKEHGLNEVIIPAAYSIRSDFMEARKEKSNDIVVVTSLEDDGKPDEEEDDDDDGLLRTVLARENPIFSALKIRSSNPK